MRLYVDSRYHSPYALSAYVSLRVKDLVFDIRTVDLEHGDQHHTDYATVSPTRRVPTLVDGDFQLSESSAISEYLEEVHDGAPLYPADSRDRARARQVQAWLRSDLLELREDRSTEVIFVGPVNSELTERAQADADKLIQTAQALVPEGNRDLFVDWCIADVDLALMLNRLVLNGDPVPQRLVDYAGHQWEHPAIREWLTLS